MRGLTTHYDEDGVQTLVAGCLEDGGAMYQYVMVAELGGDGGLNLLVIVSIHVSLKLSGR